MKKKKPSKTILYANVVILILIAGFLTKSLFTNYKNKNNNDNISSISAENSISDVSEEISEASEISSSSESSLTEETSSSEEIKPTLSQKNDWRLLLVNPWNKLPQDFEVTRTMLQNEHSIDERAYPDLQEMMDDCRKAGLSPMICSSYRDVETQTKLFNNQINQWKNNGYSQEDAEKEAAKWVAIPGTSEHHTALALDIVASSNQNLNEQQENTDEQKWLMENCWKYGFILRYPKDKTEITGITYEPWHYRYVGREHAEKIHKSGLCLEEYLETLE